MRDKKFVALHRGGELSAEDHMQLMGWAIFCFRRVMTLYPCDKPALLTKAIKTAEDWQAGQCSTGRAIQASREVHAFAKTIGDPVARAIARAVGQGVATAHMADHCMGAALYAQKAIKLSGLSMDEEKSIQLKALEEMSQSLFELIEAAMKVKAHGLGLDKG